MIRKLSCPICQGAVEHLDDFGEFDKNQKSVTFHCVKKSCECTFIIRKKKKQKWIFKKENFERGW